MRHTKPKAKPARGGPVSRESCKLCGWPFFDCACPRQLVRDTDPAPQDFEEETDDGVRRISLDFDDPSLRFPAGASDADMGGEG